MFGSGVFAKGYRAPVPEQEAMIADLEAISRRRALSTQESDLLFELMKRADLRRRVQRSRIGTMRARCEQRLARLNQQMVTA